MNFIHESAMTIARSAQGNPVIATLVVILFVVGINAVEMTVEKLIWGKSFEHWLDVAILAGSIAYAAYVVYACALYNSGR